MLDERAPRVLFVFETAWDRRQLALCREAWQDRLELVFPEPSDTDCDADFDVVHYIERAVSGALGRIDAVLSASDYPGATVASAIATRLGLPGSRPEAVLRASHKYYSRRAQREVVPQAVPRFALVRPGGSARLPFPFPAFVKPVKGSYSVLARRVESPSELEEFLALPQVREFTNDYLAIFNRLLAAFTRFEYDGRWLLVEELLRGQLVTVEGFVCAGDVEILGIVDSVLHAQGSFARFDYPSSLPPEVQARMRAIAARVVRHLGLDWTLWNVEMIWDAERDAVRIIEVNPRICGQFADLYQKVDGTNGYAVALSLARGIRPKLSRGAGRSRIASSHPLRVFEPVRVSRAPTPDDVAAAAALFPETLVWNECSSGDRLENFSRGEDGASFRYGVVNLGADTPQEREQRFAAVCARLGYAFAPL
jgi:biotin carboxylase